VDADPDAAAQVARLCEYLPLALRIAATRLAQRPEWTVRDFATRLADPQRRLDALTCDGLSVRTSLRAGARLLQRIGDPSAERVLRLLGALDLPVVGTAALAVLLAQPHPVAELTAERLVDAGMIETISIDQYRVPELVRLFARAEYAAAGDERAATGRVVEYYESRVRAAPSGQAADPLDDRPEHLHVRALHGDGGEAVPLPVVDDLPGDLLFRADQQERRA